MQIANIAGRAMRFVRSGDPAAANTLVLVHAFPVGVRLFEPQQHAYAGWQVVAPALPGFDGSDLLDQASADDYARHVVALMDALGIGRAIVGGVSLGGYVTFGVLRQAMERVAGVILADTRSSADSDEARAGRRQLLETLRASGVRAVADQVLPKLLGETSHRTRPALVAAVRRMIEGQTAAGVAAAIEVLMTRPDSTPLLSRLRVPALVIAGDEDVLTPRDEMAQMASVIPAARFVALPGAGHLANMEAPGAFNAAVEELLREASG